MDVRRLPTTLHEPPPFALSPRLKRRLEAFSGHRSTGVDIAHQVRAIRNGITGAEAETIQSKALTPCIERSPERDSPLRTVLKTYPPVIDKPTRWRMVQPTERQPRRPCARQDRWKLRHFGVFDFGLTSNSTGEISQCEEPDQARNPSRRSELGNVRALKIHAEVAAALRPVGNNVTRTRLA